MDPELHNCAAPELSPDDYYLEGKCLVFTAAYHLRRGYCCNSGCQHCPYRDTDHSEPALEDA